MCHLLPISVYKFNNFVSFIYLFIVQDFLLDSIDLEAISAKALGTNPPSVSSSKAYQPPCSDATNAALTRPSFPDANLQQQVYFFI